MTDPLFDASAAAILRLVCGLPSPAREGRIFLALEAYIDDSKTDGRVLVLAGFLAEAEKWAAFSTEWQALLNELNLPRFKMTRLKRFQPDKADEYAERFYRIVERYVVQGISSVIEIDELESLVAEYKKPSIYKNPYIMAFWGIVDGIAKKNEFLAVSGPVNFIFDNQDDIKKPIRNVWDEYLTDAPPEVRKFFGSDPRFESDDEFLPLQGADLEAWWFRKGWHREGGIKDLMPITFAWEPEKHIPRLIIPVRRPEIVGWLEHIKRQMVQELFEWGDISDPSLPLHLFDFSAARIREIANPNFSPVSSTASFRAVSLNRSDCSS